MKIHCSNPDKVHSYTLLKDNRLTLLRYVRLSLLRLSSYLVVVVHLDAQIVPSEHLGAGGVRDHEGDVAALGVERVSRQVEAARDGGQQTHVVLQRMG